MVFVVGMIVPIPVGVGKATLGLPQETCITIDKKTISIFAGD
jgi:phosphohistidine swiveling domain-containing protein